MLFSDWEKHNDADISASLLWEYDLNGFDWNDMQSVVVQRVIERGWMNDFYAAIRIYGGMDNFKNIVKRIPVLSDKDIHFVCSVFNLEKKELRCCTRRRLREKHLNS